LNEILNHQGSPFEKTGIGYSEKKEATHEEASTYSKQSSEERTKSYADIFKHSTKIENNNKEYQHNPRKTNLTHREKN